MMLVEYWVAMENQEMKNGMEGDVAGQLKP